MTAPQHTGYRDVRAEILRRIRDKVWPPGDLLPNETDLAAELGCARATVNRAMRELAEEGVLDRKRKAGTRVAAAPVRRAQFKIPLVRVEIEAAGAAYGYELLSRRIVEPPEALARYHVAGDVAAITCLHRADGAAYQFEERWISLNGAPAAKEQSFEAISPNEWLVKEAPFTDVEISFSADAATPPLAKHFAVEFGSPIFVVERATWAAEVFITYAKLSHPKSHRLTTRY